MGQIDIDSELVASRQQLEGTDDTTVMMLNNGCLCCTVRDDLVDALGALVRASRPLPPPLPLPLKFALCPREVTCAVPLTPLCFSAAP